MDLVVDANILFAALIKEGSTAELLFVDNFQLHAPEFLLEEMDKYRKYLRDKTERTDDEFEEFFRILKRRITFVPREEISGSVDKARRLSPDPDDMPYFALAIKLGCGIWSNDAKLKNQKGVAIYSTREILDILG
jgi:predicted nucleic acid-binding protein